MIHTYSDNKYIYSVDMMIAYIQLNKNMIIKKIQMTDLISQLQDKGWGEPTKNIKFSAQDVLDNPKKYEKDYKKILKAQLKYPIITIINKNNKMHIVDGVHRLAKAYIQHKKYINAYVFDQNLIKKFIITKHGNWDYVDKLNINDFIVLYINKFLK